jgi:hypothetical protein
MFHGGHDTFTMVANFINNLWEPTLFIMGIFEVHNTIGAPWQTVYSTHVIVGIFEVHNTTCAPWKNHVKVLLDFFGLLDKIIAYVKDEGSNLSTLTLALTHVVTCSPLQSTSSFVGSCFGHAMSKVCNMLLMIPRYVMDF